MNTGDKNTTNITTGSIDLHDCFNSSITTSNLPIHSHTFSDYSYYQRQPFSKSNLIDTLMYKSDTLMYKSDSLKEYIDLHIDVFTDDALIECLDFSKEMELLNEEIFWYVVNKNAIVYPIHKEYHNVDDCLSIIEKTKNKNMILFTSHHVRNNKAFNDGINMLKLKGKL